MIVLQSAVDEVAFEVLYKALMASKMQRSIGCISYRYDLAFPVTS